MLSEGNIINKKYDTSYHTNSVSETETTGYILFGETKRGSEMREAVVGG
jgi:hypothetical protein